MYSNNVLADEIHDVGTNPLVNGESRLKQKKRKEINPYVDVDQHEYEIFVSKREANNSALSRALGHQSNSRAHIHIIHERYVPTSGTMYFRFRCVKLQMLTLVPVRRHYAHATATVGVERYLSTREVKTYGVVLTSVSDASSCHLRRCSDADTTNKCFSRDKDASILSRSTIMGH
eukprot:scaffold7159_cov76-Skeletonema_dohrnii-CCMP3373.AAC.1